MGVKLKKRSFAPSIGSKAVGKKGKQISAGKTFTSFNESVLQITNLTLTGYCRQTLKKRVHYALLT